MKKLVLLVVLAFTVVCGLWTVDCFSAELKGKMGVGFNWPGVHFRYCVTDNLLVDGKVQFGMTTPNITVGGRASYILMEIPGNMPIMVYAGGEFDWVTSNVLSGGYLVGGLGGVELMLSKNISAGVDAGLFWADIWYQTNPHYTDYGLIINAGMTYYF